MNEPMRPRSYYRVWRDVPTRWGDNDVYGHVNNVIYYEWIDTAVNTWLIESGMLDPIAGDPIGLVVETGCRYARSVMFPHIVQVGLSVGRLGRTSVQYHVGIFEENFDGAAAEGVFIHVYVDRATRRPEPLPDDWRRKLEAIAAPV